MHLLHNDFFACFSSFQELFRKIRSILNELTQETFQELTQQLIIDLDIDTKERLEGLADLTFEKVCSLYVVISTYLVSIKFKNL